MTDTTSDTVPFPVDAVLFDVIGTLVDPERAMRSDALAAVTAAGGTETESDELVIRWTAALEDRIDDVVGGRAEWRPNEDLSRASLQETVDALGLPLDADAVQYLGSVGSRYPAWPDSAPGLRALGDAGLLVAGLTNGSPAPMAEVSRRNGLMWHALLVSGLAATYKPAPAAYLVAIDSLRLDPARTLFVAAHPWDLRAAAKHGFRTAYVARLGADRPNDEDTFDLEVQDVQELAARLAPVAPGAAGSGASGSGASA